MVLRRDPIPSPNYSSRGGTAVRLVVLHTTQGAAGQTYRDLGAYFAGDSGVSSHVGIDDYSPGVVGEFVPRSGNAWTQGNANPYCVSAELCARAEWTAGEWAQRPTLLSNAAAWVAEECAAFGIPVRALSAAEAQGGAAGVCQHADLGAAGGGHWDCGPGFPIDDVLEMAAGGRPNAIAPATDESEDNMVLADPISRGLWIAYRDGSVHAMDGAPYLGGTNNAAMNAGGRPCIGIAASGADGYALVLEFGSGDAGDRDPRTYHFPRDGSAVVR